MSSKASKSAKEENLSKAYVQFIDILFAVVIGQSFVLLSSDTWFATWLAQPVQNAFRIATLILIYALLISSWVGYHQSTQQYPIKSAWRFFIDIILLFVYYMGFVNAGDFYSVTVIFALAFGLYTGWDAFRFREYYHQKEDRRELLKRLGISAAFMIVFIVVALIYAPASSSMPWTEGAFFVVIVILLVLYRILKWYRRPLPRHR